MRRTASPISPAAPEPTGTPTVIERDVTVGGVRLHVREVGEPSAPPVVFLHGLMGHRRDWDALIDRVGARYRVIVVDQRGHGRAAWTPTYRLSELAGDAIGLIEQFGVGPVPVVGHSMGAMVALAVAARRPELVERIALIDFVPESLTTDFAHQLPEALAALAEARYRSVDEAVVEWRAGNPLAQVDLLRNYVAHALVAGTDGALRWGFDAYGLQSFITGVTPDEMWAAIDAVACPALVVRGEHSPLTTRAQVEAVARRLGDAHVVEISGGGHDLGVEQPDAVTDAALAFLAASGAHAATA